MWHDGPFASRSPNRWAIFSAEVYIFTKHVHLYIYICVCFFHMQEKRRKRPTHGGSGGKDPAIRRRACMNADQKSVVKNSRDELCSGRGRIKFSGRLCLASSGRGKVSQNFADVHSPLVSANSVWSVSGSRLEKGLSSMTSWRKQLPNHLRSIIWGCIKRVESGAYNKNLNTTSTAFELHIRYCGQRSALHCVRNHAAPQPGELCDKSRGRWFLSSSSPSVRKAIVVIDDVALVFASPIQVP